MPILNAHSLEFISRSAEQTRRLGMRLGAILACNDLVCLSGDLGSGKTTFVQGIAKGWGSLDPVSSPTFVLVNQYGRPDGLSLHHMDAYRLENACEAEDLDLDRMLENGSLVVEWAERIQEALPKEGLWVKMAWVTDEQRSFIFDPTGTRYQRIINIFRQKAFGG